MNTRLATADDFDKICLLLEEMRGETVNKELLRQQYDSFDGAGQTIMVVTDDDDIPVGMAVLNLVYKLPKIECRIDEVIVSESQRGKGLGTILMAACEEWAWDQGSNVIELTSRPSREAANHLYQKLGYQIRETNVYTKKNEG